MLSPSPVPLPTGFVVKNGLNILLIISSGIPFPVSETFIIMFLSLPSVLIVIFPFTPFSAMECSALFIRFNNTCWSWCSSARVLGKDGARLSSTFISLTFNWYALSSTAVVIILLILHCFFSDLSWCSSARVLGKDGARLSSTFISLTFNWYALSSTAVVIILLILHCFFSGLLNSAHFE